MGLNFVLKFIEITSKFRLTFKQNQNNLFRKFFKNLHLYSIRILIYMFLNQLKSFKIKKTPSKTL